MEVRTRRVEELKPNARERAMSPRQSAALQREEEIRKALGRLKSDEDIIAIELDAVGEDPDDACSGEEGHRRPSPGHRDGHPRSDDLRLFRAAARRAGTQAKGLGGRPGGRRTVRVPCVPPADTTARSRAT